MPAISSLLRIRRFPAQVTPYTGTELPATSSPGVDLATSRMFLEAQAVTMSHTSNAFSASPLDIPVVCTSAITAEPCLARISAASPTDAQVTATLEYPMENALSAPATMSMAAVRGSSMFPAPTASTTAAMGSVSTMPEILPPRPCTTEGSVTTAVPHPSAARTTASSPPSARPVLSVSDTPNERKSLIDVSRQSVHIPNAPMRYSTFSLTESSSILSMPLYLANSGHHSTSGSVTSTTRPSSIVTRLLPRHSITCLDIARPLRP